MATLMLSRETRKWEPPYERMLDSPKNATQILDKIFQSSITNTPTWQDTGASLAYISPEELDFLKHLYIIREPVKVTKFLHIHPFLVSLLMEAYFETQLFFPNSEIALQIVSDPEEDYQKLFAYILTQESVKDALARLDKFDDEWFLDQPERIRCVFNLNLEFV